MTIEAKFAGGAVIFVINVDPKNKEHLGKRNVQAVEQELRKFKIRAIAKDVDGKWSRTITFYPENAVLKLKKSSFERSNYDYTTKDEFI